VRGKPTAQYRTRRAEPADIDAIALAHRDSIRTIGALFYPSAVVDDWGAGIEPALYLNAMKGGEVFFIATETVESTPAVLGFSSDYRVDGRTHGTSVYVRGSAARQGIGSALLAMAEAHAVAAGATAVQIEASLAGVEFYRANGFVEVSRGEVRLTTGRSIACVHMRKRLERER
jgi:ribosomal protein S18 acetylase RimI-like enzyme